MPAHAHNHCSCKDKCFSAYLSYCPSLLECFCDCLSRLHTHSSKNIGAPSSLFAQQISSKSQELRTKAEQLDEVVETQMGGQDIISSPAHVDAQAGGYDVAELVKRSDITQDDILADMLPCKGEVGEGAAAHDPPAPKIGLEASEVCLEKTV